VYDCKTGFFSGSSGFYSRYVTVHLSQLHLTKSSTETYPAVNLELLVQDRLLSWCRLEACGRRCKSADRWRAKCLHTSTGDKGLHGGLRVVVVDVRGSGNDLGLS
jgi:hypothetical protein